MRFCTARTESRWPLDAEMHGRKVFLRGAEQPLVTDIIHPDGPADLYVRPGDLRLADPGSPGIEVHVTAVQRTGPIVRASAEVLANGTGVSIELPHLHHDAARFQAGATLRLKMMQFCVYPRAASVHAHPITDAPEPTAAQSQARTRA
jgi:sulfate/thiosulfate transport system ATP-binding protein